MIAYEYPAFKELKHGKKVRIPMFLTNVNSVNSILDFKVEFKPNSILKQLI